MTLRHPPQEEFRWPQHVEMLQAALPQHCTTLAHGQPAYFPDDVAHRREPTKYYFHSPIPEVSLNLLLNCAYQRTAFTQAEPIGWMLAHHDPTDVKIMVGYVCHHLQLLLNGPREELDAALAVSVLYVQEHGEMWFCHPRAIPAPDAFRVIRGCT